MEEASSLKNLTKRVRKHRGVIAALTLLSVLAAGVTSYFLLTPVYETLAEILVDQSTGGTSQMANQNLRSTLQLINTYSGIIKSPAILDQVIKELNLEMTSGQLEDDISVSNDKHSQVMTITVRNEDPATAVKIANTTVDIFENDIKAMMKVENVSILSRASVKENPEPVLLSFRFIWTLR